MLGKEGGSCFLLIVIIHHVHTSRFLYASKGKYFCVNQIIRNANDNQLHDWVIYLASKSCVRLGPCKQKTKALSNNLIKVKLTDEEVNQLSTDKSKTLTAFNVKLGKYYI